MQVEVQIGTYNCIETAEEEKHHKPFLEWHRHNDGQNEQQDMKTWKKEWVFNQSHLAHGNNSPTVWYIQK